jgi:hypothetical protein
MNTGDYFYKDIEYQLKLTIPNAKIVKVSIIMNNYLW